MEDREKKVFAVGGRSASLVLATTLAVPLLLSVAVSSVNGDGEKRVVCYVGTWAVYRKGLGSFDAEHVDANLCTHLVYSFVGLDNTTNRIVSIQEHRDVTKDGFNKFLALKKKNPRLKVMVAVGGWNEGAEKYSKMAATKESRNAFIRSAVEFIKRYGFDGLDLDWEYPAHAERGGDINDKQHFTLLVQELRASMPKSWLLTAAISANKYIIDDGYEMNLLSREVDFFNVMCYDYHGNWESKTGHNAPLYSHWDHDDVNERELNVNFSVHYLLKSLKIPPDQITVGVPFYGHTFRLKNVDQNSVGSASERGEGDAGQFTGQSGFMGYNEICNLSSEWTDKRDDVRKVPYKFLNLSWISFDDPESIYEKARMIAELDLGGAMIWSLDTDDFLGVCSRSKFPLAKAVVKGLGRQRSSTYPSPFATTTMSTPSSAHLMSVHFLTALIVSSFLISNLG